MKSLINTVNDDSPYRFFIAFGFSTVPIQGDLSVFDVCFSKAEIIVYIRTMNGL